MIRRPPRSTLFPTRRSSDLILLTAVDTAKGPSYEIFVVCDNDLLTTKISRSEEHTSELQSHLNLVCRLLLEKKKKTEPSIKVCLAQAHDCRAQYRMSQVQWT